MALVDAPSGWQHPAQDEENGGDGARSFWKSRAGVAILGAVPALAAVIAFNVVPNLLWPSGEISETWTTVERDGMSLELPDSFDVYTEPEEAVTALGELEGEGDEQLAQLVEAMPEAFVVLASHDPSESEYVVDVSVLRFPVEVTGGGTVRELANEFLGTPGPEYTVLNDEDVVVGTDDLPAVRFDVEQQGEGDRLHERAYVVVDGEGAAVWLIDYAAANSEYDRFEPVFDRSIASLELP
jgi:hypothetical protein